jgi:hypothetical protein
MDIHDLLQHLDRVRQSGNDKWTARCPAHDDKGPSLAIRHADDGRILLHCFAGCSPLAVLDALGLEWADLFPPREDGERRKPIRRAFRLADALSALRHEAGVLRIGLASGTPVDKTRMDEALGRILAIIDTLEGSS